MLSMSKVLIIPNAEVTFEGHQPKSYAFCSDTAYKEDIIPIIKGC